MQIDRDHILEKEMWETYEKFQSREEKEKLSIYKHQSPGMSNPPLATRASRDFWKCRS